ncbi:MAG: hypothetical protein J6Y19_05530, partial [Kiritimatiellae bacterium]|nr:hypothetical protein [Kiritimatiellia bacterium]
SPAVDESPLPLVLWHISQIANPEKIKFHVPAADTSPTVMAGTLPPDSYSAVPQHGAFMATYTPAPSSEVKFSLPSTSLAAFSPFGRFMVDGTGVHAELYSNTGLGYAELETLTPPSASPSAPVTNTLSYIVLSAP